MSEPAKLQSQQGKVVIEESLNFFNDRQQIESQFMTLLQTKFKEVRDLILSQLKLPKIINQQPQYQRIRHSHLRARVIVLQGDAVEEYQNSLQQCSQQGQYIISQAYNSQGASEDPSNNDKRQPSN